MHFEFREINNIVLKNVHWSSIEKYDAIDDISFEQLKMFSKQLKHRLFCRMLIQGNMLKSQAVDVMNIVTETLKYKPLIDNTWPTVIKSVAKTKMKYLICDYFSSDWPNFR